MVRYRAWRLKEKHIRFQSQNAPAEAKGPEVRIVGKGGTKGKARVFAQLQQNLCLGVGTFDTSGWGRNATVNDMLCSENSSESPHFMLVISVIKPLC